NNSRVRIFVGTNETMGRAILLEDRITMAPKERSLVQLVADEPVVALAGDRFVIRDETNVRTLGGGVVLNPLGRRSRKPLAEYRRDLALIRDSEGAEALEALINLQESLAQNATALAHLLNVPVVEVQKDLKDGRFVKLSMGDEVGFTTIGKWEALKRFTANAVKEHHEAEPLSPGLEM